jgi:hypothetical protein
VAYCHFLPVAVAGAAPDLQRLPSPTKQTLRTFSEEKITVKQGSRRKPIHLRNWPSNIPSHTLNWYERARSYFSSRLEYGGAAIHSRP